MPRVLREDEIRAFREALCEIATRRFAEEGYAGVTMRGLAAELGVSPMTPYRYFENKDQIFHAVRVAAFARFADRQQAVARKHEDPIERLRASGREYVRFAREEPHAYRIMFELDQPPEAEDPEETAELQRGWQVLLRTMQDAVKAGRIIGDPTTLAHLCWVMMHGAVTLHLAGKLRLGRALDEIIDPLMDNFLHGSSVGAPARGAPR